MSRADGGVLGAGHELREHDHAGVVPVLGRQSAIPLAVVPLHLDE
jgi:hypothetical protein